MSRKRGKIENIDISKFQTEEETTTETNQEQDVSAVDEEIAREESAQENEQEPEVVEEQQPEAVDEQKPEVVEEKKPVKTLWELAMEEMEAEQEEETEDEKPGIGDVFAKVKEKVSVVGKNTTQAISSFNEKRAESSAIKKAEREKQAQLKQEQKEQKEQKEQSEIKKKQVDLEEEVAKEKSEPKNEQEPTKQGRTFSSPFKRQVKDKVTEEDEEIFPLRKTGTITSDIGFFGINHGTGVTYSLLMCATSLKKHYKVAVLEFNSSKHFGAMFEYIFQEIPGPRKMFSYSGVDFYFNLPYEKFAMEFRNLYDFVLIDFGVMEDIKDYLDVVRCDRVFTLIEGDEWRLSEIEKAVRQIDKKGRQNTITYLTPLREPIVDIKKICHPNPVYKLPYSSNPFKRDDQVEKLFYKLLQMRYRK